MYAKAVSVTKSFDVACLKFFSAANCAPNLVKSVKSLSTITNAF